MTYFEYTKYGKEFLITRFEDGLSDTVKIRFRNHTDGSIQLGAKSIRLENGLAILRLSALSEGVYTPIFHSLEGSFICDKINFKAGKAMPLVNQRERLFELTEKLIFAEEKINCLENRVTELCSKVYAKNIF